MTARANQAAFESWNGDSGRRWAARADQRDRVLAPVGDALLAAAAPTVGMRVLDVGCGCGATTLAGAALVGARGSVTGIDLSAPMLDLARQRAAGADATNVTFVQGDAQTHAFEPGSFDLVISRFGTMFFADPTAAFANVHGALAGDGRLCLATWQPLGANQWLTVPGAALLQHAALPDAIAHGPGMFAQSDPDVVAGVLGLAGFADVAIDAHDVAFTLGDSVDDAVDYLADSGPGRAMLETIAEPDRRDAALTGVRTVLARHHDDAGVRLGGAIWLVRATR